PFIPYKTRTCSCCGTLCYQAPEVILNKEYSFPVDWWGVGAFIFEMLSGKPPSGNDTTCNTQQRTTCYTIKASVLFMVMMVLYSGFNLSRIFVAFFELYLSKISVIWLIPTACVLVQAGQLVFRRRDRSHLSLFVLINIAPGILSTSILWLGCDRTPAGAL
ncbi:unnamed protein product, partial [Amoebophrya sp. A25]